MDLTTFYFTSFERSERGKNGEALSSGVFILSLSYKVKRVVRFNRGIKILLYA